MTTTATPNRAATAVLVPRPAATPTATLAPTVKMPRDHPVRSQADLAPLAPTPSAGEEARTLRPPRSRRVLTLIGLPVRPETPTALGPRKIAHLGDTPNSVSDSSRLPERGARGAFPGHQDDEIAVHDGSQRGQVS